MTNEEFENILVCPNCHTKLKRITKKCPKCQLNIKKEDGIYHLVYIPKRLSKKSQKLYDNMHLSKFLGPEDGSYEIFSTFAKGNRTVDIACGSGQIEKLSPDTVAVEFSQNALKKAKANGAKFLVLADAHALPFQDNSFDLSISAGNLEHFENPQKAILEMARISKIQILTVHKDPPFPFASTLHELATKIFMVKDQPIEKPVSLKNLVTMIEKANLHIVFKGVWTLPFNYGHVIKFLPEFKNIPSCNFIISVKK